ncbi:MAG: CBS domain-containing protein, partial [Defluviitoga tunisiensis]
MYIKLWQNTHFAKIDYYETVQEAINKLISIGDSLVVIRRDGTLYNLLSQMDIEFLKTYEPNRKLIEILDPTDSFLFDDDLVEDALVIMLENRVKVLPVVDSELFPVGTFGFFELLKAFKTISAMDEAGTRAIIKIKDEPGELNKVLAVFAREK